MLERVDNDRWKGNGSTTLPSLGFYEPQFASDSLKAVPYMKSSRPEVDVLPREPEGLALSQSKRYGD
jgi:hypothetical protein